MSLTPKHAGGRPQSRERLYAEELKIQGKRAGGRVVLPAGADRLARLEPCFLAVLTRKTGMQPKGRSLKARGIKLAPRSTGFGDRLTESAIQEALRERGLN